MRETPWILGPLCLSQGLFDVGTEADARRGLALTLIHLISIPVTNTSVNPARSTGVAVYVGGWAIAQLWLFWAAPIVGAVIGAQVYRFIGGEER